jgi:hypothetical protein
MLYRTEALYPQHAFCTSKNTTRDIFNLLYGLLNQQIVAIQLWPQRWQTDLTAVFRANPAQKTKPPPPLLSRLHLGCLLDPALDPGRDAPVHLF